MLITSKSNPLIKKVAALSDKKFRKQLGLYVVEGLKTVNECILAGCQIENIICTEAAASGFNGAVIVSESVFKSISSEVTPQGVMAIVRIPQNKIIKPENRCLLLDRLQDPGNLGTVIRTANAAGYEDIYLINCTDPYSPKAVRASMSGIFFVNLYQGSGEDIFSFKAPKRFCLCVGNEGAGISKEIKDTSDYKVKIPMRETCESLNAAVSAGIAMYTLNRNIER